MSEYKQISSGGRYRNNVGGAVADKLEFQKKHKFAIAFENCSQPGYSTEKILEAFASQSIPIYWGDPLINQTFNEKAFINCHSFASWEEVVERIRQLDNDDAACLEVLNAPVFVPEAPSRDEMIERLRCFLYHIYDQNPSEATRYNRYYWGLRYLKLVRTRERAYRSSPRGLAESLYKKTLWRWRRNNKLFWKIDRLIKR
ncbi:MAG: glycosyltransferase family 10 [Bacteroidales bacterium]|nr:glycosyltransferase family 10 [Bacteroidales bacterium]